MRRMRTKALLEVARGHKRAGRKEQAECLCREVLTDHPDHAPALYCLGELAFEAGQYQLALECFTRALDSAPKVAAHCLSVGATLLQLGRKREAVAVLRKAVILKPQLAEAQFRLGLALTYVGDLVGGFEALEHAVTLRPKQFEIQRCFALVLKLRRERERAVAHYEQALELKPGSYECWLELANVLRDLKQFDAAKAAARRAISLNPTAAQALEELGWSLYYNDQIDESIDAFRHALRVNPEYAPAYLALAIALQAQGSVREAITCFRYLLASDPNAHHLRSSLNYLLPFVPEVSPADILQDALEWNHAHGLALKGEPIEHANNRTANRRLRVGYVSNCFRDHQHAYLLMPLLENHDGAEVEVFCYSSSPVTDEITTRLRAKVDVWRDISLLAPAHAAILIRSDKIDILVDLTMHMSNSNLLMFASKPAPIQCCWLAYPGTTGLSAIDYRITDPYLDPPQRGAGPYSERSLVLPDSFWCYDPMAPTPDVGPLPAQLNGYVTFGSLNDFCKLNGAVIELWAQVLTAVRGSRLILLAPLGQRRARIHQLFEKCGVPNSRVAFVNQAPRAEYLQLYNQIDIGLDTVPYGGHEASLDAFWMGIPVVSLVGSTVVGRAGVTYAMNLDLRELIAQEPAQFVAAACGLADDLPRLSELRGGLRKRMQASPLMDGVRFARHMEAAYRIIWERWCYEMPSARTPIVVSDA
jgi:protein O-GlcNAc transferase